MKSIRNKFFLQIGMLTTALILLIMIANTLLVEPYYLHQQRAQMLDYFDAIKENFQDGSSDAETNVLSQIESEGNMDILIQTSEENTLYASANYINAPRTQNRPSDRQAQAGLPQVAPVHQQLLSTEDVDGNLVFTRVREANFGIENLILTGTLDNGNSVEIRTPLQYMQASIDMANQVLLIVGAGFIFISMIFAYLLSNSFTKPILAISKTAERMQSLDFDTHCDVSSQDELGQLATNINHMSDTLSETIEALHIRDEKRRTLLNNVSHELKTPLTLMQGYATALQRNILKNPEKTAFYTEVIIDETEKISLLVETLLDIDQLEVDKARLVARSFEINGFIREIFNKFEPLMQDDDLNYQLALGEDIPVVCDPILTERVLKNLLSNALRYMGPKKVLQLSVKPMAKSVRVEVINSSEPVPEQELEKLWESFYKMDKARTRELGGHGLGLSIVKAIQEAHGQAYGARNVTEGLCFWFEIARAEK
jgi:signal transduction histidine kinase